MTRADLLSMGVPCEDWIKTKDGVTVAYRLILKCKACAELGKIYLIVFFQEKGHDDCGGFLDFWDLAPEKIMDGYQSKPNGKYTEQMRNWFSQQCGVKLPIKKEWGHLDASYDPWNQTSAINCNYKERFDSEQEWAEYKKWNRF